MSGDDAVQATAPPSRLFAQYDPRPAGEARLPLPAGLRIEPATPCDAQGIALLLAERNAIPLAEAEQSVARWLSLSPVDHLLLVARDRLTIVAYARVAYVKTPPDPEFHHVPAGWYLLGIVRHGNWRRQGIGEALTRERLSWIGQRTPRAYYFVNSTNRASIDLHARFGFLPVLHNFRFPQAHFSGGTGVLYSIDLPPSLS